MSIITDPLFYLVAIPAIVALGLGKGGFAGVGMISTPLLALTVPPLQAVAILLPILLCQDAISAWAYRREWSGWNLKVLLPGSVVGVGAAWLFAAHVANAYVEIAVGVTGVCFALYAWFGKVPTQPRRPSVPAGLFWGSLAGVTSTIIQGGAPPEQVHILDAGDLCGAVAVCDRHQLHRAVAGAPDPDRAVLQDHLCADVPHFARVDLARRCHHRCRLSRHRSFS